MIRRLIINNKTQLCLLKKIVSFLLAVLVLIQAFAVGSAQVVRDFPARVRVLLTEYQNLAQIKIGVHGAYSLDKNISFQKGSEIQVSVISDSLQVSYEGMVYLAGSELTFYQHDQKEMGENGLRLQDMTNLFPGDLKISAKGGKMELVSSLPIERYLQGVVPYEMADEFPLEALKAQAVAARTYTLSRLDRNRAYDLVDNTNDQVYRGINPEKKNAVKAVIDTEGLVLIYKGNLANCFYTASNGGYTESAYHAWGREQIPYLTVQKDQYDFDNPLSIVKSASIAKQAEDESGENSGFYRCLTQAFKEKHLAQSNDLNLSEFKILGITALTPHSSKYADQTDGVMSLLKVDMIAETTRMVEVPKGQEDDEVSLAQPSGIIKPEKTEEAPKYVKKTEQRKLSLDIPVFPDLEKLLNLSINKNENEIISILEKENAFVIQFRRYGHGVGMSQRGAEWMAKNYNWNHEQILRFYYPGTSLEKRLIKQETLPSLSAAFLTTPGPAPTATPRPTLMPQSEKPKSGQSIVHVTGIGTNSSLNLRAKPDYLGEIITRLYYGQELLVIRRLEDGWLEVKTDAVQGFIREEFVVTQ